MNSDLIRYVAFYDKQDDKVYRNYVTSASNKIEYIATAIASIKKEVEIISTSEVREKTFKFYPRELIPVSEGVTLRLPFSFGGNNIFLRKLKIIWHLVDLFLYLLIHCAKDDKVIVYHSLAYFDVIRWAKRIRNFQLILEVEEIYTDVSPMSAYWRKLEFRMFKSADAFIFSNDLLNAQINPKHKPSAVVYGTYHIEPKRTEKFQDGKIHVVYAGTFDRNKGGAEVAISTAEFLPTNYHVHICGFGNEDDVIYVKDLIKDVRQKSKATITYDGLKRGEEFIEFLQKCHIGLSTQKPEGEFNDTSFPSKILTYMSNGLSVVSIRIPVLEQSALANRLCFYDVASGKILAEAIQRCDLITEQSSTLHKLDTKFKNDLLKIV